MSSAESDGLRELWHRHRAALQRYEAWAARHQSTAISPAAAFAIAAGLYELLPHDSRARSPAVEGIAELRRRLAVLRNAR